MTLKLPCAMDAAAGEHGQCPHGQSMHIPTTPASATNTRYHSDMLQGGRQRPYAWRYVSKNSAKSVMASRSTPMRGRYTMRK